MTSKLAAPSLQVTNEQREALKRISRSHSLPHRSVVQAKALLMSADGVAIYEVARTFDVSPNAVRRWRRRFESEGVEGVGVIAPGRGRSSWLPEGTVAEIVAMTMNELPDDGSGEWSTRTLAKHLGVSKDTVARVWRDHGLKPWKLDTFKVSTDLHFEEKLVDVVGLYMNPPERAVVFSFDEKTQVQALDRTQPSLPMKKGRGATMTHDYKRHGTTDLFAAMNVATGQVLYDTKTRHSSKEVLDFFKYIDQHVAKNLEIHVVLDNLSAHKAEPVATWLAHPKRARWHLHFTPTSSSWLNLVESWFSQLTNRRLKKGTFSSVAQLKDAIGVWTEGWNEDPQPFIWKKPADEIIAKVQRGRLKLASIKSATDH
ncbi:MAG: IS630 family transposase [Acidimicrobiales bacterium]